MQINNKKISMLLVVLNIIMIVSFIFLLIFRTQLTYGLFWLIVPLLIVILMCYINEWTQRGQNPKRNVEKTIQRTFDDVTTVCTVIYAFIYLIIMFLDTIEIKTNTNIYVAIGFYIITIVYEWIIYTSVEKARVQNRKLIKEQGFHSDSNDTKK